MTVRETFAQLPTRFRPPEGPTGVGDPYVELPHMPFTLQYEIKGPGGGLWQVVVGKQDCQVVEGAPGVPYMTIQVSAQDWLALWQEEQSVWALMRAGRITFVPECDAIDDLPYLGVLGPAAEPPRPAWWMSLHRAKARQVWLGYVVSGAWPDHEKYLNYSGIAALVPNWRYFGVLLTAIILGLMYAPAWWPAIIAFVGLLAVDLVLAGAAHDSRSLFTFALITGLLTVRSQRNW